MGTTLGVLLIVVSAIVSICRTRRLNALQDQQKCQAEYNDAERGPGLMQSLLDRSDDLSWILMCRELTREGRNRALKHLLVVKNDEWSACELFMAARTKLEQAYTEAKSNLELTHG